MLKVEKGYGTKRLVAEFPRKKAGLLLLWNACCTRLTRLDLQTVNRQRSTSHCAHWQERSSRRSACVEWRRWL